MTSGVRDPSTLVDALREAILDGRLAPGTRLVQEELAARYGTSRIPLREALRRLEGEGLVRTTHNRGAVVRPLSPKDVADLYDVRLALETLAVRRAAARLADLREPTGTGSRLAAQAASAGDLPALFHLDRDFHASITAESDNEHLVGLLDAQWSQIMRVMHAYLSSAGYPANVWRDHARIAADIAHGDGDGAASHLHAHLTSSRDSILTDLRALRP
jgi:DNA-binding GntR family transcriptional regulator